MQTVTEHKIQDGINHNKALNLHFETHFPDTPHWIIFCTVGLTEYSHAAWIVAIVDNEIDLVRASQLHIFACGEDHRSYMHVAPYTLEMHKQMSPMRFVDRSKNLYRPDTTNLAFTLPVEKGETNAKSTSSVFSGIENS